MSGYYGGDNELQQTVRRGSKLDCVKQTVLVFPVAAAVAVM